MSRATRRQSMLTENMANINTPGYKRKDIDFNIALDDAMGVGGHSSDYRDQRAQAASDQTSIAEDGNNVDLEREVAGMAETDLRFQALTDMTAAYFSGLKSAIREGR